MTSAIAKIVLVVRVVANALPILLMIALIPLVENDFVLTAIYVGFILVALAMRQDSRDFVFLAFGFFTLLISEYFFISTGVERFERRTLFGVMPLWLPFLWAYAFLAIRRMVLALERYVSRT